jgi:Helix-loop-helix DNA-binding domain
MQYDDIVSQCSPGALQHPSRLAPPDTQSHFVGNYLNVRRSPVQNAPSTPNFQHRHSFGTSFTDPDEIAVSTRLHDEVVLPNRIPTSPRIDRLSESNVAEIMETEGSANARSGKRWKAAHRAVERRYRSNLNLKIIKLGQCIPAIRHQVVGIDDLENADECRTIPKSKLQKGHVLSKAVDYIQSLQQLVSDLEAEKRQLENKVESLRMMVGQDCEVPSDMAPFSQKPGMPERPVDPAIPLGSRLKKGSSKAVKSELGTEFEAQPPIPPRPNGFSFVAENPSLSLKRPRIARGDISRLSSG